MEDMARLFLTTDHSGNHVLSLNAFNGTHLVQAGLIVLVVAAIAFVLTNLSSFSSAYQRFDTGAPSGYHPHDHPHDQIRHRRAAHDGNLILIFKKYCL